MPRALPSAVGALASVVHRTASWLPCWACDSVEWARLLFLYSRMRLQGTSKKIWSNIQRLIVVELHLPTALRTRLMGFDPTCPAEAKVRATCHAASRGCMFRVAMLLYTPIRSSKPRCGCGRRGWVGQVIGAVGLVPKPLKLLAS